MSSGLRTMLFSRALAGETAGQLAARYAVSFDTLAKANRLGGAGDVLDGRLVALPWQAFREDAASTPLGKLVLQEERAVLEALKAGLPSFSDPERITGTGFVWDFAALGTIVSFTVSDDALVLTTDEGVGAVERLAKADEAGAAAVCRAVSRLCRTMALALQEHRARPTR
jgi:hypothetical protein